MSRLNIPIENIFEDALVVGIRRRGHGSVRVSAKVKQFDAQGTTLDETEVDFTRSGTSYSFTFGDPENLIDREQVTAFQVAWIFRYDFTVEYPWATQNPYLARPQWLERFWDWVDSPSDSEEPGNEFLPESVKAIIRRRRRSHQSETIVPAFAVNLLYQLSTGTWSDHALHHSTSFQHSFTKKRGGGWETVSSLPDPHSPERSANCSVDHICRTHSSTNGTHNDSEVSMVIGLHGSGGASVSVSRFGVGGNVSNRSEFWEQQSRAFKVRVYAKN